MMNLKIFTPKKWFEAIGDRKLDLQERLYRLLVTIGLCGLGAAIINEIVIGEDTINIISLVAAFFVFTAIVLFSIVF